jgi:hypothetical protein
MSMRIPTTFSLPASPGLTPLRLTNPEGGYVPAESAVLVKVTLNSVG